MRARAVNVAILVLSWGPDAPWLRWSLRSIQRFARGFSSVTVVYPYRDGATLRPICEEFGAIARPHDEPPPPLGHLAQNLAKCMADTYCPEAAAILHWDSDCIAVADVSPEDFLRDGKPVLAHRSWKDAGAAQCWREPTARALGWDPPFETMVSLPILHDARIYPLVRRHVQDVTGAASFEEYVLSCHPTFPYGFAEFNVLGSFALEARREECAPVLVAPGDVIQNKVRQLWSHDGLTADMEAWLEETIAAGGEQRPPPPPGSMTEERRCLLGLT